VKYPQFKVLITPFPSCSGRGPYSVVIDSYHNLKENFYTMYGALDGLQMKEEDVLKFLAKRTHLATTNLDIQMEHLSISTKRKSDVSTEYHQLGRSY
jgi:hypothetical protein